MPTDHHIPPLPVACCVLALCLALWCAAAAGDLESPHDDGPAGPVPSLEEQYLQRLRRPLLQRTPPAGVPYHQALRARLEQDFAEDLPLLQALLPECSDRQRLVHYLVGRVHGSLPVYALRKNIPDTLEALLFSHRGNCADHAIRLMLVLDAFHIATAWVSLWSPSLPGHIVVDAFDPEEHTAYLLDSNNNVIMTNNAPAQPGGLLLDALYPADNAAPWTMRTMPARIYYVDPGFAHYTGTVLSTKMVNHSAEALHRWWTRTLTTEFPEVLDRWRRNASTGKLAHIPLNLQQFRALTALLDGYAFQSLLDTHPYYDAIAPDNATALAEAIQQAGVSRCQRIREEGVFDVDLAPACLMVPPDALLQ